jgi:hypothetical protein
LEGLYFPTTKLISELHIIKKVSADIGTDI